MADFIWRAEVIPGETGRMAAERFVREYFEEERSVIWSKDFNRFWFHDSAWQYELGCDGRHWWVSRTSEPTKKAKQRARARSESRARKG